VQEQTSQGLGCWHALRVRTFTCLARARPRVNDHRNAYR
jgi:hypothetical protein